MSSLRIETIAIGDELLTGKISDTNSSFIAKELFARGVALSASTVIPDRAAAIRETLTMVSGRADVAICFGGLGPTSDDITAEVAAEILGCELIEDATAKAKLLAYLKERNRPLNVHTLEQVLYPALSEALTNFEGYAPGFTLTLGKCRFYFLPGVPVEMMAMARAHIFPQVETQLADAKVEQKVWRLLGIPESEVQRLMTPVEGRLPKEAWLGYRTRPPENYLYLYVQQESATERGACFAKFAPEITELVKPWTYATEEIELEEIVFRKLKAAGLKVALAESCTGGMTVQRLTQFAGASDHIYGSYVTYQIAAKSRMLGVELANETDAVSADCSRRLAEATLQKSGADIAGAITGYLGPTGGTKEDPVGTIYTCVVTSGGIILENRVTLIVRARPQGQWAASDYLLDSLRQVLEKLPHK